MINETMIELLLARTRCSAGDLSPALGRVVAGST